MLPPRYMKLANRLFLARVAVIDRGDRVWHPALPGLLIWLPAFKSLGFELTISRRQGVLSSVFFNVVNQNIILLLLKTHLGVCDSCPFLISSGELYRSVRFPNGLVMIRAG